MTTEQPRHIVLSVLLFQEGDAWVLQGLEHDLAAQGPSIELAQRAFLDALHGQLRLDQQANRAPLAQLPRAPMEYWYAFDRAMTKQLVTPATVPAQADVTMRMPPAYMIQAITDMPPVHSS
jgi:hypothetical protein